MGWGVSTNELSTETRWTTKTGSSAQMIPPERYSRFFAELLILHASLTCRLYALYPQTALRAARLHSRS